MNINIWSLVWIVICYGISVVLIHITARRRIKAAEARTEHASMMGFVQGFREGTQAAISILKKGGVLPPDFQLHVEVGTGVATLPDPGTPEEKKQDEAFLRSLKVKP